MKIGNIDLKYGLMLAPMAGVTDYAFRSICKNHGVEYMVSEMISAKGMHYNDDKTMTLAKITDDERPMGLQIFGSEPEIMAEAALGLQNSEYKPEVIDINMGCPMKKIVGNGEGSALMLTPELARTCIRAVVEAVKIPVTVKIRSGWNFDNLNAVEIARIAESEGAAAICVHGRTKTQMYLPPVDLEIIKRVKAGVSIPVIGNGGIDTAQDAMKMYEITGCDGIMVARGAMGNPWIFDEILAVLKGIPYTPPNITQRLKTAVEHAELLVSDKGDYIGVREGRKHMAWYIKGVAGASAARQKINTAETLEDIRQIVNDLVVN
jgi:putative TIM-barrel protein, nifR3 family